LCHSALLISSPEVYEERTPVSVSCKHIAVKGKAHIKACACKRLLYDGRKQWDNLKVVRWDEALLVSPSMKVPTLELPTGHAYTAGVDSRLFLRSRDF
jgi:hypothetical protein